MIESLTEQQQKDLVEFRKTWFDVGSSCEEADREKAEEGIAELYKYLGKTVPRFVWMNSPFGCSIAIKMADQDVPFEKLSTLEFMPINELIELARSQGIKGSVYNNNYFCGQHDSHWIAFYLFCEHIGVKYKPEDRSKLESWKKIAESCMWFWPFEEYVFISNRAKSISWNADKTALHEPNGPAVEFRDGWKIYSLNGIRMQEWHVMTPSEKIDVQEVLKETNVDIRRELLRKIGVERFVQKVGAKVLDKQGDYELLSVDFPEFKDCRFLKMRNPSVEAFHIEGIENTPPNDCNTVQEAINWRKWKDKNKVWSPAQLT